MDDGCLTDPALCFRTGAMPTVGARRPDLPATEDG
jgi:hypothetical protein